MKIHIASDYWNRHVRSQPGKTWAEKQMRAESTAFAGSPARPWHDTMTATQGQWVEVETKFLFEDQFNTETARVACRYVDAIDFSPEFSGVDEYLAAVQERYDKDWPGRKVKPVLARYILLGGIKDETPNGTPPQHSKQTNTNQ